MGKKYIIEIDSVYNRTAPFDPCNVEGPANLYRVKGFNSLVFDTTGLDKLEKYDPKKRI